MKNYQTFKLSVDFLVAFTAIVLLSPLLLLVGLLVYYFLGLPVLFIQERPGFQGKPFYLLKFRTMATSLDCNGRLLPDSQRLTSFGRWLRSTSIDELPGLINILCGEMSFIGPRPLLMQYLPLYSSEQSRRHDVKPGFSGWAQINGRNAITWEKKFSMDVWYAETISLSLDMRILLITILKVLRRDGINAVGGVTVAPFAGTAESE